MTDENVYVKVEEYKDIVDLLALINEKVNECKVILNKVHELKSREDEKLGQWASGIEEIEKKMEDVNAMIAQSK